MRHADRQRQRSNPFYCSGVYAIIDRRLNVPVYVGQTHTFIHRWKTHVFQLRQGMHGNKRLQSWYDRLVTEGHKPTFRILEKTGHTERLAREAEWIRRFNSAGYVLCNGDRASHGKTGVKGRASITNLGLRLAV